MNIKEAMEEALRRGLAEQIRPFNDAAYAPIPGLTGPRVQDQTIPRPAGMAPLQQGLMQQGPPQIPNPQQPVSQFQPQGPYGQTAMQMAGLLAQPAQGALAGGLLSNPVEGFRIPGYRPYGK